MENSSIEIKNLRKTYGSLTAVNDLSLNIGSGELFGLLGVNGAGKTTTIKMLSCLIKPDSGEAFLGGNSIITQSAEVKRIINLSTQETAVAPKLTVRENLEFVADIYGVPDRNAAVESVIKDFSLESVLDRKAKTLSGGWQRKVSIAMALVTSPRILFLDEPTLGLDVLARRELWTAIKALKSRMTIILTTHYLDEAEALCDRIAVMTEGCLRAVGTADELKAMAGKDDFEEAFIEIAERSKRKGAAL
ncbi:MAG: ABC transporter ATP-binding protein [Oscillospiraceae bacterium]|nr:ABC transporter ATP-binding protein [Oscillospiraceae bacterium]